MLLGAVVFQLGMTGTESGAAQARSRRGRPRSIETEQAILRAALEILESDGFAAFSIETVAARAGVGRPSVYRRWPSKIELAIDAVVRLAPPLEVIPTGDPMADLRNLTVVFVPEATSSATGRALMALTSDPETHAEFARPAGRNSSGYTPGGKVRR
jgi:AcrR family transcriptional regulator